MTMWTSDTLDRQNAKAAALIARRREEYAQRFAILRAVRLPLLEVCNQLAAEMQNSPDYQAWLQVLISSHYTEQVPHHDLSDRYGVALGLLQEATRRELLRLNISAEAFRQLYLERT